MLACLHVQAWLHSRELLDVGRLLAAGNQPQGAAVRAAGGLPQLQFWGAGEECTILHLQGCRALVGRSGEDAQLLCMWLYWAAGKLAWKLTPATLSVNLWSYVQGSSMGQFYREHLQPVRLNRQDVNWTAQDLSHLEPDVYNAMMRQKLAGGTPASSPSIVASPSATGVQLQQHLEADPCCDSFP